MSDKIKVFTHNDLDGIGCAILARMTFGDNVDIQYCTPNNVTEFVADYFDKNPDGPVYITDLSISDSLADRINNAGKNYVLLDHHQTAMGLNQYTWCYVSTNNLLGMMTSGTELFYHYLVANMLTQSTPAMQRFVEIVRDYDTWRWAAMGENGKVCKDVNDLMYIHWDVMGLDYFIDWAIDCIMEKNKFPTFSTNDNMMLKMKRAEIESYINKKIDQMLVGNHGGKQVAFVFCDTHFNDIGHAICNKFPGVDYVAMVDASKGTVSLRTERNDIDLGAIAKSFGGGGHKQAAGFAIDAQIQKEMLGKIFRSIVFGV